MVPLLRSPRPVSLTQLFTFQIPRTLGPSAGCLRIAPVSQRLQRINTVDLRYDRQWRRLAAPIRFQPTGTACALRLDLCGAHSRVPFSQSYTFTVIYMPHKTLDNPTVMLVWRFFGAVETVGT